MADLRASLLVADMSQTLQRILLGYSVVMTTLLAALALSHAIHDTSANDATFDQLDVHRINIREPDGTLRMTISNSASAPGTPWKGKEIARPDRKEAGILFMNDEGTENGGLIFGGAKKDGKVSSFGHLSFDQYEQDQVISLDQSEEDGHRRATLVFADRPDASMRWDLDDKTPAGRAEIERLAKEGAFGRRRLVIGKGPQRESAVVLADAQGHERLILKVTAEGAASIQFLDEKGNVVRDFTPAEQK
jgi:hypothetical protein